VSGAKALAFAALAVLASGCSDGGSIDFAMPPSFDLRIDESSDRAFVNQTPLRGHTDKDVDPDWSRNALRRTGCLEGSAGPTLHVGSAAGMVNQAATSQGVALALDAQAQSCSEEEFIHVSKEKLAVKQGDFLAFCSASGVARNVSVELVDAPANAVLDIVAFSEVQACA
jgi:hypothetical protein